MSQGGDRQLVTSQSAAFVHSTLLCKVPTAPTECFCADVPSKPVCRWWHSRCPRWRRRSRTAPRCRPKGLRDPQGPAGPPGRLGNPEAVRTIQSRVSPPHGKSSGTAYRLVRSSGKGPARAPPLGHISPRLCGDLPIAHGSGRAGRKNWTDPSRSVARVTGTVPVFTALNWARDATCKIRLAWEEAV